jgi:hypothetical protein
MLRHLFHVLVLAAALSWFGVMPAVADTVPIDAQLTAAVTTALDIPADICSPEILHVAQVNPYALVEWQCGEGGGELLLQLQASNWQPISGDGGSYESRDLIALGVPEATAVQLVQQLQAQWSQEE